MLDLYNKPKATVSHPGRAPVDVRGDPVTTGNNRSTSVTLPATSGMIREHPAFDPGWNKIFNITGVVRDDPGRYSFAGFILSSVGNDRD
jgi:hypothetical protein